MKVSVSETYFSLRCEQKFLPICCKQWELGTFQAAAELVEIPNLFTLNLREEKQLIRSRLRVVEEYNRMPGAHRLFMVAED